MVSSPGFHSKSGGHPQFLVIPTLVTERSEEEEKEGICFLK
jgi:hypothetical protein